MTAWQETHGSLFNLLAMPECLWLNQKRRSGPAPPPPAAVAPVGGLERNVKKQRQPERQAVAGSSFPLPSACRVPVSWSCAQLRTCSAADRRRRPEPISTVWPASEDLPSSPAHVAHWQSMILSTQAAGPGLGPAACWGSPASLQLRKGQRGG